MSQTPCALTPSHRVTRVLVGTFSDSRPEEDSGVRRGRPLTLGSIRENVHPSQGQGTGQASRRKGGCRSAPWWGLSAQSTLLCQHSLCWPLPDAYGHRPELSRTIFCDPRDRASSQPQRLCPLCGGISDQVLLPQASEAFRVTGDHCSCQNLPREPGASAPSIWSCLQTCGKCLRSQGPLHRPLPCLLR